jgi:hypothetical protein
MASHRATGDWVRATAERRLARSLALVQAVESAPVELPSETLARPLSIRPAPPGVLDDQGEGTVQSWGLSTEGEESTTDVTRLPGPSVPTLSRWQLTWALGTVTAAALAALVAVAVWGARDTAISERVLQPTVPAVLASSVGPGRGGEALEAPFRGSALPTAAGEGERPEPDEDSAGRGDDGPSPPVEGPRPKPKTRVRGAPARAPRPHQSLFIPTDI